MNYKFVEVCVDRVQSAINAEEAGASRLELCSNLIEGGTTPNVGILKMIKRYVNIPVNCMIRPRGGDFLYSTMEFETMMEDINLLKINGADGFVFGILKTDGSVDADRCSQLINLAQPLPSTFHRAFDMTIDWKNALETIIKLGFTHILTSGCSNSVIDGLNTIKEMVDFSDGRIIIMPGCGITEKNIKQLFVTGAKEFHGTFRSDILSEMKFIPEYISIGSHQHLSEFSYKIADKVKICEVVKQLRL